MTPGKPAPKPVAKAAGPRFTADTVYWLEDPQRRFAPELAGDVEYRAATQELCYYDTQRPHVLKASFTGGDAVTGFKFAGEAGRTVVVRKLDKAAFERLFRALAPGAPPFKSDADVQKFYLDLIRSG